uniref:Putative LRR receptor-like serine/threonine-protein kinase n=1 Tax=Aegilops tauschii TaxID=37682 RepID=R7W4H7_AEGTA
MPVVAGIRREAEAPVKWKACLASADESLGPWSMANSTSLCRWTYITCDSPGHITELVLEGARLNGTLHEFDFSAFPHMEKLMLYDNGLYGTIPAGIGNLLSLVELEITSNPHLRGAIPGSIGQLKHLVVLELSDLGLNDTLPQEIGNLTTLEKLRLSLVTLTGSIPLTIGKLMKLRFLSLTGNNLTGSIPMEIGNLTKLQNLYLQNNYLEGQLPGNQLVGHIFPELGNSSLLDSVGVANSNFSGLFPPSICVGGALTMVSAGYNGFTGIYHQTFQNCTTLQDVDFTANNIIAELGTIPSWISRSLPGLKFLRLSSNKFEGAIPLQILHFHKLQLLDLTKNKLTGPVPDDFTNFTGMAHEQKYTNYIDAGYNSHPQIQIVWKNVNYVYIIVVAGMVGIDLSGNFLSQGIPNGLTTLLGLRYLNLSRNHLSGFIPEDIGNLVLLESLDLSGNQLSGKIPASFAGLRSMTVLNLLSNTLSGRIPTGNQLQTLDDPSIHSNNSGLCGFPLKECVNSSTPTQNEASQDEDREALWLYCFVAAGFIFGFWLYWGIFLFRSGTWRCAFYQYVDNMQVKPFCEVFGKYRNGRSFLALNGKGNRSILRQICWLLANLVNQSGPHLMQACVDCADEGACQTGLNGVLEASSHDVDLCLDCEMKNQLILTLDFSAFPHLGKLTLFQNGLYGTIPAGIGNLTSLVVLQIILNPYLRGAIPCSIGQLKNLAVLEMKGLGLDSMLPEEIGNLTSLEELHLNSVTLTGSIPPTIGMLTKLRTLSMRYNNLTGSIPLEIGNMTELQELYFSNNYLEGQLPDLRDCFQEHLGQLETMAFSQNHLYGTLLTDQGEVFLCNYTALKLLDLSNNALHGGLSKCFWDFPSLAFMDLSSNSFSGVVPISRTCADNLKYLHLAENHFRGTFPLGLKKCKNLITLDLGGNHFSGTIPSWVLDLSKNKLTGPIPDDFTNFTSMAKQNTVDFIYHDEFLYAEQIQIQQQQQSL